jgi:hypothetical protein
LSYGQSVNRSDMEETDQELAPFAIMLLSVP